MFRAEFRGRDAPIWVTLICANVYVALFPLWLIFDSERSPPWR